MKKEIRQVKIGDKMWNSGSPIMEYEVVAKIIREKNVQYELSCKNCNHSGGNCRILITRNDFGKYVYVAMVNENCDDDIEDRHYYFHFNNGNFYLTKEEGVIERIKGNINDCNNEIEKKKQEIEYCEKRKKMFEVMLIDYKELLNKQKVDKISEK